MGRKSVKKNPNIYQRLRDGLDLTREEASELLEAISADRIEKIENERSPAQPEEVLLMSEKYKAPSLCNYYCANECPIGRRYVPEVKVSNLAQIILQMVSSLNAVSSQKDRLIEIAADSQIENDELEDFVSIQEQLEQSHVPAAPEVDTSHLPRGEILRDESGTHYVNREFGIACDLDGDWYILSDEELAQVAGLTVDTVAGEDVRDAFASAQIFCEFGALRPSDSASMMLMIEDLEKSGFPELSEEEYREASVAELKPQADALGATRFSASENQVRVRPKQGQSSTGRMHRFLSKQSTNCRVL